jgi:hypothetical protein
VRTLETRTGLEVAIRSPRTTDDGYVFRSALKTIRDGRQYRAMPSTMFYDTVGERFRGLWRDRTRIRIVACLPTDEDFIVGFCVGDPSVPLVDYLHVRGGFTGQGVATLLLNVIGIDQESPAFITFETHDYETRRSWPLLVPVGGNKKRPEED